MRNLSVNNKDNKLLIKKSEELLHRFHSCLESMLTTYSFLFNNEENKILVDSLRNIKFYFEIEFSNENERLDHIKKLLMLEDYLKPLVIRCW